MEPPVPLKASEDMRDCSSRLWLLGLFYFLPIDFESYRLVTVIIKITAITEIKMPVMMLVVSASPNIRVPTSMAVIGSKTPNTEALVAPIFLVAIAKVAVETIVGRIASPMRLTHAIPPSSPVMSSVPDIEHLVMKTTVPTNRA